LGWGKDYDAEQQLKFAPVKLLAFVVVTSKYCCWGDFADTALEKVVCAEGSYMLLTANAGCKEVVSTVLATLA
jgi:hypothetical protein